MNKSKLKRFATTIRVELMQLVSSKLDFLLELDINNLPVQYKASKKHIETMLEKSDTTQKREDFIEEVAYTWFNRLIALRFMDANGITDKATITPLQEGASPSIFALANSAVSFAISVSLTLEFALDKLST